MPALLLTISACNLGLAYFNLTTVAPYEICLNAAKTANREILDYCQCCDRSHEISGAINTCPDSDLSRIDLPLSIQKVQSKMRSANFNCAPILNSKSCTEEFGMQLGAGSIFYDPLNFPPGVPGTKPVSDVGSFTTFPGPQTTVIGMYGGYTSTVTMVPWGRGSGATGTAKSATGTGIGTAQPASSTSKSSASTISAHPMLLAAALIVAAWIIGP